MRQSGEACLQEDKGKPMIVQGDRPTPELMDGYAH